MKELMEQAQALLDLYAEPFAERGIQCALSKRYFETRVTERHTTASSSVLDKSWDEKREKKYKHQNNRYHCMILSVSPLEKGLVRREDCREYALLLRKIERPHTGVAPRETIRSEERVLHRLEKRIRGLLRRSAARDPRRTCKDTWQDALRYLYLPKYGYKKTILGKDPFVWDMSFLGVWILLAALLILTAWLIGR